MKKRKGRIFAHLGHVINPDVCVLIADFYMRISNVLWSIVSGVYANKLIIIIRNDGLRKNAGNVVKASFGNIGSAGGHKSMARAEIMLSDLEDFAKIEDEKRIQNWIIHRIESHSGKK
jgi:nanoRNase/pAp phosphatase (c-di-AMP/oligoRNAs hydrolase)